MGLSGFWWWLCFCVWFGFCLLGGVFFNSLVGMGVVNLQVTKNLEFYKGLTTEIIRQSKLCTCFELII